MQIIIDTLVSSLDDLQLAAETLSHIIRIKSNPLSVGSPNLDLFHGITLKTDDAPAAPVAPVLTPATLVVETETPVSSLPSRLPDLPAAPSDPNVELDSDGKPWDETIHSESRAKVADGTWRKRRGGPKTTPPVPEPPAAAPTPVVVAGAVDNPLVNAQVDAALLSASPVVVPLPPPPPAAAEPAVTEPNPNVEMPAPATTFRELTEKVTRYFAARKIDSRALADICGQFGIESIQACYRDESLIPLISAAVDEHAVGKAA